MSDTRVWTNVTVTVPADANLPILRLRVEVSVASAWTGTIPSTHHL